MHSDSGVQIFGYTILCCPSLGCLKVDDYEFNVAHHIDKNRWSYTITMRLLTIYRRGLRATRNHLFISSGYYLPNDVRSKYSTNKPNVKGLNHNNTCLFSAFL